MPATSRLKSLFALLVLGLVLGACDRSGNTQGADTQPAPAGAATHLDLPQEPPTARLPAGIVLRHYRLHLAIDPRKTDFSGLVEIDITLAGATDFIWLHGEALNVSSATAELEGGKVIELQWQQATATGVARLTAAETLPAGKATLTLAYTAPFNTNLEGLFKVEQGADWYAFTQFESTSARLAFPAFDEPAFKVKFDISLTVPEAFTAIANTPVESERSDGEGSKTLQFATTKPLPTYLIAFAVGPFDVVEWQPIAASERRETPLPLRGITTRGKGEQIHFALENTAAIVLAMEDYFDTPYPFAKLDLIAVPDFSDGAMENAGAITYREQLILLDDDSSVSDKRDFYYVHAHELSHQWFGDLVTAQWWDDIWLNESFATWNAFVILDSLYPDQHFRESLQNSSSQVMRQDGLASARQVREPITRHEDIQSAFNGITYEKGAGVLSMFESFLGRDNFRDGIRHYMQTYAYGSTTATEFIGAIADANPQVDGADLREAFRSYIEQPGLPLLAAGITCDDKGVALTISQQRYLPIGSRGSSDQLWTVPVCTSLLQDGEPASQCFLLKGPRQTVALASGRCPDALLPNAGGAGYYRWTLEPEQWQALMRSFGRLSVNEQMSVANSLSAALNSGTISLQAYLATIPTIARSDTWRVALAPRPDLYKIKEFASTPEESLALERLLRQWYQPRLDELNALPELEPDQKQFRALLMSTLALGARDPAIRAQLAEAGSRYAGFGGDRQVHADAVDPNIRDVALRVAIEAHGKPYADLLWQHFLASDNATLRQQYLGAMAWSPDPEVARQVRDRILSPELKDNEIFDIFSAQAERESTRQALWDWTVENMDALLARMPSWARGETPGLFAGFCSEAQAASVEAAFAPIIDSLEAGPRSLANSLETIRLCNAFVEFHRSAGGEPGS